MKFMKLLTSAYVGGVLRHPHEGVIHVQDDEAKKLIADKVAEDVTSDFSAEQRKSLPAETVNVDSGATEATVATNPHQSEIAPQAATPTTPQPGRKAAADKE